MWSHPTNARSFYGVVDAPKHIRRQLQAECVYGLVVDHQLELRRQLNRQIARLRPLQDAAGIEADLMVGPRQRGTIAHQTAALDVYTPWVDRRELVTCRQRDDFSVPGREEWIGTDRKRASPLLGGGNEGCLQVAVDVGFQHKQAQAASARYLLHIFYLDFAPVRVWIHEQRNGVSLGHHPQQQLHTLLQQLDRVHAHAAGIAARMAQARHEAHFDGIKAGNEKNRDGPGGSPRSHCRFETSRNDRSDPTANQIGHKPRQPVGPPPCPAVLDSEIPPFDIAALIEALQKWIE